MNDNSLDLARHGPLLVGILFFAILACLEIGRRLALRARRRGEDGGGVSSIDGAMFAVFGLLLAFTFAGAASRFEARRDLIRSEANAIGTAWLRLDLLPADAQPALRADFRAYVTARLASFDTDAGAAAVAAGRAQTTALQTKIWQTSVAAAARVQGPQATTLLLPALNEMTDITTTRDVATQAHPPLAIYMMLVVLALACSFVAGAGLAAGERRQQLLHVLCYAIVISLTIYIIVDLEFPRLGLIRINSADHILRDVRASMTE